MFIVDFDMSKIINGKQGFFKSFAQEYKEKLIWMRVICSLVVGLKGLGEDIEARKQHQSYMKCGLDVQRIRWEK